jgi:hypothetical protein
MNLTASVRRRRIDTPLLIARSGRPWFETADLRSVVMTLCFGCCGSATATDFDHKLTYDDGGIWNRNLQKVVEYGSIAVTVGGAAKAAKRASAAHFGKA